MATDEEEGREVGIHNTVLDAGGASTHPSLQRWSREVTEYTHRRSRRGDTRAKVGRP